MALNFPANTSLPYVDPISGLKYIYNSAVGAWEAAIQPPAVISDAPPALNIPGFLWWDNTNGALYIWYQDEDSAQWVDATASGVATSTATISEFAPTDPAIGELWWNTIDGRLYIWYDDTNSKQWIQATPNGGSDTVVNYGVRATSGPNPPSSPSGHDLWYNTSDRNLYDFAKASADATATWLKTHDVIPQGSFIKALTGSGAVTITSGDEPSISIDAATATDAGIIEIADVTEAKAATDNTKALTPGVLKESITSYIDTSHLATKAEVQGINTVDPIPVGTVIQFAGLKAPVGYIKCDGSSVFRNDFLALFQVIVVNFGIGDGVSTFNIPNLTSEAGTIKCIKF